MKARPQLLLLLFMLLPSLGVAAESQGKAPQYDAVAPLLRKYCVGCHSADDAEGGLMLDSYTGLLKGGKRGAALVALFLLSWIPGRNLRREVATDIDPESET